MIDTNLVYVIIHKSNGKIYVGKTDNLERRISQYKRGSHAGQTKLFNATEKYGWEDFEFEIIENNILDTDICKKEMYWIRHLCAVEFGYNLTYGGDGMRPSEETRKKMSDNHADFSGSNHPMFGKTGPLSPNFGKKDSPETRQKKSKNMLGIKKSPEAIEKNREAKRNTMIPVECVTTGKIFESLNEVERKTGIKSTHVSANIKGKCSHCKGFVFRRLPKEDKIK